MQPWGGRTENIMRQILNFNDNWEFFKDVSDVGTQAVGEAISLPHTWNGLDGQDGGNDYFRGTCLYKKVFRADSLPKSPKYYLEINGANSSADVYMNGKRLAHHDGGYSTWRVNITGYLRAENTLSILVPHDQRQLLHQLQRLRPFGTGQHRSVRHLLHPHRHLFLHLRPQSPDRGSLLHRWGIRPPSAGRVHQGRRPGGAR